MCLLNHEFFKKNFMKILRGFDVKSIKTFTFSVFQLQWTKFRNFGIFQKAIFRTQIFFALIY